MRVLLTLDPDLSAWVNDQRGDRKPQAVIVALLRAAQQPDPRLGVLEAELERCHETLRALASGVTPPAAPAVLADDDRVGW